MPYLDHAATTPPLPAVLDAMQRVAIDHFGNPSSTHLYGTAPKKALLDAREFLRGTLGAAQVVLTSGGTEADVLGLIGAVQDRPPGRVLVGAADHAAILAQRARLAHTGHRLVEVPVDAGGTLEPEALFERLGKDVRAVAILHGHNELGGLARLDELVDTIRRVAPDAHVHVDLVQSYGKISFELDDAGVDSVALSGHKLQGPRGVGLLALSSTARIAPLFEGGGQENGLRGGTENVAGAVGLAVAAEHAFTHLTATARRTTELAATLLETLTAALPSVVRLGVEDRRLPHVLSLRLPGIVAQTLQERASARGLAFSTGAACHAGHDRDNHVLAAIGLGRRAAREVLRLSLGATTTAADVETAGTILIEEAQAMLAVAP